MLKLSPPDTFWATFPTSRKKNLPNFIIQNLVKIIILLEFIGYISMMSISIYIVIKLTPKLTILSINILSGVGKFCFFGIVGYAGNVGYMRV